MIFDFGSISDLYNKLKLLTSRVTNTEAVNIAQNTRLTNIETKNSLIDLILSDYIYFKSGFSANLSSYMRKYGNLIDLYLVVNGTFSAGTNDLCTLNTYAPYSKSLDNRRFPVIISNGGVYTYGIIDTSTGLVRVVIPRDIYTTSVIINLIYTV